MTDETKGTQAHTGPHKFSKLQSLPPAPTSTQTPIPASAPTPRCGWLLVAAGMWQQTPRVVVDLAIEKVVHLRTATVLDRGSKVEIAFSPAVDFGWPRPRSTPRVSQAFVFLPLVGLAAGALADWRRATRIR